MKTGNDQKKMIGLALALFLIAGLLVFRYVRSSRRGEVMIYFYDLSEKELFAAPQSSVPPIRGINDEELDGVRARVISNSGDPRDRKNITIAYLEKYSPEMKAQFERMKSKNSSTERLNISRAEAGAHTFVKRPDDSDWYPMTSDEAAEIVSVWARKGPDGRYPVVVKP